MKGAGGYGLRQYIPAAEIGELAKALTHGLLNLAGIRNNENAPASAFFQIAQRNAFEKEGIKGIGEEDRYREFALTAKLARADHDSPRFNVVSARSRIRSPRVVNPSSSMRPSWRSQLIATHNRESV